MITEEQVLDLLDSTYYLKEIDYRSNLNSYTKEIAKVVRERDYEPLDSLIWQMFEDYDELDYPIAKLKKKLEKNFELSSKEADALIEEYDDNIRQTIWDRDKSEPLADLIRNTSSIVAFYDTGIQVNACLSGDDNDENLETIKAALQINDDQYDETVRNMCYEASYGGTLVIYFHLDIEEFIRAYDAKTIKFSDPCIAVINTFNGSGADTKLKGYSLTLPFNSQNVFLDKEFKYNYTYAVCGMSSNWCESTSVELSNEPIPTPCPTSLLNSQLSTEETYTKTFLEGHCTPGDMDVNRHRHVSYRNEFPCGLKCSDCGTFWID